MITQKKKNIFPSPIIGTVIVKRKKIVYFIKYISGLHRIIGISNDER